jgi:hypothetical protein
MSRLPTLFIPHGGGPCFFMNWDPPDTWHRMAEYLRRVPDDVGVRPRAVLEGQDGPDKIVILEFPDEVAALEFHSSAEYQEISVDRKAGADALVLQCRSLP